MNQTKNIKVSDNGGITFDRYTVIYLGEVYTTRYRREYSSVSMSSNPFHPQGFCQHGMSVDGVHLGKQITFEDLPVDCQKVVLADLELTAK